MRAIVTEPPRDAGDEVDGVGGVPACVLIILLALVGFGLRMWAPGADPPLALTSSNAEVMDGPWYLAEAVDGARGNPIHVQGHYRLPLITWSARPFLVGGVSLARVHAWSACWGALLVLLGAGAAWTAFGRRAAVLAALLLATNFVLVGYGRVPVVYGPLAAGLAGVAWLHALGARRWLPGALAWVALGWIAVGVKDTAVVAAPALVLGHLARSDRPRRAAVLGVLLLIVAGVSASLLMPSRAALLIGKAQGYFGDAEPLVVVKRCLRGAFASGLLPKALALGAVAWLGGFALFRARPGAGEPRHRWAFTCMLAAWMVTWLVVFGAFQFQEPKVGGGVPPPPLRYFVPALVPAALLAAAWLAARWAPREQRPGAPRWWLVGAWVYLGTYWLLGSALMQVWWMLIPGGGDAPHWLSVLGSAAGLASLSCLVAVTAAVLSRLHPRWLSAVRNRVRRPGVAVVLVAALLAMDGVQLWPVLARPDWTLARANELTAELFGVDARVMGSWAHALTYDHPTAERHYLTPQPAEDLPRTTRRAGITHLVIDEAWMRRIGPAFERQGVPLVGVARVLVRDHPVVIHRMAWAAETGYERTALERAIDARREP
jgi:hypothetical protein